MKAPTDAEVISVLRMQIGSCPHCIGNPMVRAHAARCQAARDIIERLEEPHRECGARDCQVAAGIRHTTPPVV